MKTACLILLGVLLGVYVTVCIVTEIKISRTIKAWRRDYEETVAAAEKSREEIERQKAVRPRPCPCDSCQRWSECNGVDAENCPLYQHWEEREKQRRELATMLELEDKTESGLFEED